MSVENINMVFKHYLYMSTAALTNLWNFIQGMSLSDRQWLTDKLVESNAFVKSDTTVAQSRKRALTDEEMEEELKELAPLTDADFPEVSREQFVSYVKAASGKMNQTVSRWL